MYYFDNEFLKGYLDIVPHITVYVNGQPYSISSKNDLADTQVGVASDEYGKAITFTYPQIQQVVAKGQTITIDQLQKVIKGQAKPQKREEEPSKQGEEGGESPKGGGGGGGKDPFAPGGGKGEPSKEKGEEKPKNPFAGGGEEKSPPDKEQPKPEKSKKESVAKTNHFFSVDNPASPQYGLAGVVRHQDGYGIVIEAYNKGETWQPWDMVTVRRDHL